MQKSTFCWAKGFLHLYLRFDSFYLALQTADQAVDFGHLSLHHAELVPVLTGLHRHLVKLQTEGSQHELHHGLVSLS